MGQEPFILALDVGTSSTRTLLFDATGTAVPDVRVQHSYQLTTSNDGEVSVDADTLVDAVVKTIDEALKDAGPLAADIGAVATDTFWHGLVGVDASNNSVTPLITWEDTRPLHAADELRTHLDETEIHARTGARLHASYWPAKLRWLETTQPEVFAHTAQWLSFGEYLHRKVLGRSVCSLSMASGTGLLVTRERAWDTELAAQLGIKAEQLPPLGDLKDSIRGLTPSFVSRWPALFPSTMTTLDMAHIYGRVLGKGLVYRLNSWALGIDGGTVTVFNLYTGVQDTLEGVDTVVLATGPKANDDLYFALKGEVENLHRIGDCLAPRKLDHAIYEGELAGRELWSLEERYIYEGELERVQVVVG